MCTSCTALLSYMYVYIHIYISFIQKKIATRINNRGTYININIYTFIYYLYICRCPSLCPSAHKTYITPNAYQRIWYTWKCNTVPHLMQPPSRPLQILHHCTAHVDDMKIPCEDTESIWLVDRKTFHCLFNGKDIIPQNETGDDGAACIVRMHTVDYTPNYFY